jgi:hypothetical protein
MKMMRENEENILKESIIKRFLIFLSWKKNAKHATRKKF